MMSQSKWIEDISESLEDLSHGATLTKFVAVDKGTDSDLSVEIHGLITSDGKFIIVSEKFERKNKGE